MRLIAQSKNNIKKCCMKIRNIGQIFAQQQVRILMKHTDVCTVIDNKSNNPTSKIMLEKEIEVTAATDINYLERKNIQLRGEIQCLTDRITGLVKENESLRKEATIHRLVGKVIEKVKSFLNSFKSIWTILDFSQKLK